MMFRLIAHLVWFDLRSVRWLGLAWTGALLVGAVLSLGGPPTTNDRARLDLIVVVARVVATFLLAATIVQSDPLVGGTAFWRTRPLSRVSLLVSKLATCAILLGAVPVAVYALAAYWQGVPFVASAGVGASVMWEQALVVAAALSAAVVTRHLAQAAALVAGTLVGLVLLLAGIRPLFGPQLQSLALVWEGPTRAQLIALSVLAGLAVAVHQYLRLRTVASASLLAVAVTCLTVIPTVWPVRAARHAGDVRAPIRLGGVRHTLEASGVGALSTFATTSGPTPRSARVAMPLTLSARLSTQGLPDTFLIVPRSIQSVFSSAALPAPLESRQTFRGISTVDNAEATPLDAPYRQIHAAAGTATIELGATRRPLNLGVPYLTLPPSTLRDQRSVSGTLNVDIIADAYDYRVVATLPMSPGARAATADGSIAIEGIGGDWRRVTVNVRRIGLTSRDPVPNTRQFALRRRDVDQAYLGRLSGFDAYFATVMAPTPVTSGVERHEFLLAFPNSETWMASAELLLIEPVHIGRHDVHVTVDGFTLTATAPLSPGRPPE